ncbi:MAG: HAD hydrolase-like protein [Planctomycetes bacterium]|nr:HAD hydrolase-like protein [Planctomycetota bacterium]
MSALPPRLLCFDVDGTLADRFVRPTVPNAAAILRELRARFRVRLVSNATSESHARLFELLRGLDLIEQPRELVTPVRTAQRVLEARGEAAGLLLCEDSARGDFAWFREDPEGPAVVLATEAHTLRIAELQPAFRRLQAGAKLYALQKNRYYARKGGLVTDIGPVAAFLEYASGRRAENLGKPSPLLFESLAADEGLALSELVMIGDDAEFDASGAVALGLRGVLVRTGKYRAGDEQRFAPPPTAVLDSAAAVPGWLETLFAR